MVLVLDMNINTIKSRVHGFKKFMNNKYKDRTDFITHYLEKKEEYIKNK